LCTPKSYILAIISSAGYRLYFGQQIAKFAVIHLNAIVQIRRDALVCIVTQLFIQAEQLQAFALQQLALFAGAAWGREGTGRLNIAIQHEIRQPGRLCKSAKLTPRQVGCAEAECRKLRLLAT